MWQHDVWITADTFSVICPVVRFKHWWVVRSPHPSQVVARRVFPDGFAFDFLAFVFLGTVNDYLNMFGPTAAQAPGASALGSAAPAGPARNKLESRFGWLLANEGVSAATMDAFGDLGLHTLTNFRYIAKDDDKLRQFLKKAPFNLDEDADARQALEVAKVVAVFEAAKETVTVETKHRAERLHQDLPPKVSPGELDNLKKLFEQSEYKLNPVQVPSEAYFERKIHELETRFKAEPFSRVTNSKQEDSNDSRSMNWDNVSGTFREKGKIFSVPMPKSPEGLRARIKTMGVAWHFLRLKAPERTELRSADVAIFERYTDWLCGPDVWGHATEDSAGKPKATPHLDHVLTLDFAIRRKVAEKMNEGMDLKQAFREATACDRTMQTHFFNHVAMDIGTKKCTDCTAPGITESHPAMAGPPNPASGKRQLDEPDGSLSKGQLDRIKKKAKQEAEAAAKKRLAIKDSTAGTQKAPGTGTSKAARQRRNAQANAGGAAPAATRALPLQNGGVGDGTTVKGKGKGKGKGACYAWNDGQCAKCTAGTCSFKPICSKCGSPDHKRSACTQ
jgi:hypothetical protein